MMLGVSSYIIKPSGKRLPIFLKEPVYYQPAEVLEQGVKINQEKAFLIGIVKPGSLYIAENTLKHSFILTDFIHEIKISFEGLLPRTLREGETCRVKGDFVNEYNPTDFVANEVIGNHDSEQVKNVYQLRSKDITIRDRPV